MPTTVDVEDDQVYLLIGESNSEDQGFSLQELLPPSPPPPVPSLPPTRMSTSPPLALVTAHQLPVVPSLPPVREFEPVTRPRKRRRDISPKTMVSEASRMRVSPYSEIMAKLSLTILDQLGVWQSFGY